jgi:hypothetical protein
MHGLVDGIGAVVKLGGDALGLLGESLAAFRGGVEGVDGGGGASELKGSGGLGADRRRVQDERIAEGEAETRGTVAGDETQDCEGEVGCEDWDQQR